LGTVYIDGTGYWIALRPWNLVQYTPVQIGSSSALVFVFGSVVLGVLEVGVAVVVVVVVGVVVVVVVWVGSVQSQSLLGFPIASCLTVRWNNTSPLFSDPPPPSTQLVGSTFALVQFEAVI